jgi:hypothetical protein
MDTESVALLAIFLPHGIAGVFFGWRLMPKDARRELRGWFKDDEDGGSTRPIPVRPRGGGGAAEPPLPSAAPSAVRLREPGRLADQVPAPARRPSHPPTPAPLPERVTEPIRR